MLENIKKYDKQIIVKSYLDGKKELIRKSVYHSTIEYPFLTIVNQFIGSGGWVRRKIIMMDTFRYDIITGIVKHNMELRKVKKTNEVKEISRFIQENEKIML